MTRVRLLAGMIGLGLAATVAVAPGATAAPTAARHLPAARAAASTALGTTTVTTAPGIATTLLSAGIVPLPLLPRTGVKLIFGDSIRVAYSFPITSSTADLASATGDILHAGGISFVSAKAQLTVSRFDISLADGKVYATRVNGAAAKVALLDLDLSKLKVTTTSTGATELSRIGVNLDPAAAGALNATFGTALPTDGSLVFGTARVTLR